MVLAEAEMARRAELEAAAEAKRAAEAAAAAADDMGEDYTDFEDAF